jgi:hypothetical protein
MQTDLKINKIVARYQECDIRGVFFDLDLTLTRKHTWEELGISSPEVGARISFTEVQKTAVDPRFMEDLILSFNHAGIVVGICSGQYTAFLHRFVKNIYGEEVYSHMRPYIIGREDGTDKGKALYKRIQDHPHVFQRTNQVCLVDDDPANCAACGVKFWTVSVPAKEMNPAIHLHWLHAPQNPIPLFT